TCTVTPRSSPEEGSEVSSEAQTVHIWPRQSTLRFGFGGEAASERCSASAWAYTEILDDD
ncbi:hypothetical protein OC842_007574, partial [Tilletia horrida]